MTAHSGFENVPAFAVELRDSLAMLPKAIVTPAVKNSESDDLGKRRDLKVGRPGLKVP